jgi:hypothetical protein
MTLAWTTLEIRVHAPHIINKPTSRLSGFNQKSMPGDISDCKGAIASVAVHFRRARTIVDRLKATVAD